MKGVGRLSRTLSPLSLTIGTHNSEAQAHTLHGSPEVIGSREVPLWILSLKVWSISPSPGWLFSQDLDLLLPQWGHEMALFCRKTLFSSFSRGVRDLVWIVVWVTYTSSSVTLSSFVRWPFLLQIFMHSLFFWDRLCCEDLCKFLEVFSLSNASLGVRKVVPTGALYVASPRPWTDWTPFFPASIRVFSHGLTLWFLGPASESASGFSRPEPAVKKPQRPRQTHTRPKIEPPYA